MKFNVELNGRLGNQMFQYAFGKALSLHYCADLTLTLKGNNKYRLDVFDIPEKIESQGFVDGVLIDSLDYLNIDRLFYNELENKTYKVCGYWQNEKYFYKYSNHIKSIYKVPKYAVSDNDLVVHVRRGDYVDNPNHFYCDYIWYERAISKFNFSKLHIITDDMEWCKESFKNYNPIIPNLKEKESIGYISSFSNIIISNSTFGWWGAYLSESNNIVYPSVWLPRNKNWETAKKEWIKI